MQFSRKRVFHEYVAQNNVYTEELQNKSEQLEFIIKKIINSIAIW